MKELAMIVHDPAAHHTPTPSQLETWDASRRQDIAHQLARVEQRKAEDRATATATTTTTTTAAPVQDATLAAAIQQKRAEREARRHQLATATATAAPAEALSEADAAAIRGSEERDAPASNTVYTVSVPTTSDTFPWYDHDSSNNNNNDNDNDNSQRHTYETLDAAHAARVWSYPASAEERARCEVFRDLWEKGYYMGGGSKFGGDWLVYPGACFKSCSFPTSHVCTCARRHRRSAALSFALRCHRTALSICPLAPDGSCGARSTWYGNEEGASFVRLGPREPRSHVHQHRVGRIRVVVFREGFAVWYTVVLQMTSGRENKTSLTCAAPLPSGVV
jgi:hypothetical protein